MKDHLRVVAQQGRSAHQGVNLAREYLQARILAALQRAGAMVPLAFAGGTCLRLLYRLPRYSEDLDFSLERDPARYDLRSYLRSLEHELAAEGYKIQIKVSDRRVVHGAFIRFPGLLFELGLSPRRQQVLAVKIEVDTRPPAGATLTTTIVRRHVILHLQHHDPASLMAGKLHALLTRPYTKGRDIHDLYWYLADPDWPAPNLTLLNAALEQTGWKEPPLAPDTWRPVLRRRLERLDWSRVLQDVKPFLEQEVALETLTRQSLIQALEQKVARGAMKS